MSGVLHSLLGVLGGMLIVLGFLGLMAANRETPILGAGMLPAGALLVLARAGSRRGWKGFPWLPLLAAVLVGALTVVVFLRHMRARADRHPAPQASLPAAIPVSSGR
ncbi:MAG: hypothetical protein HZB91_08955 [Elusimicrobia bacterium]|nr:hypothetical protein [Elusimicrobiota bacterium]